MLKHLPRPCIDYFLDIFNLSWSLHSFPSTVSERHLLLFPSIESESFSTLLFLSGVSPSPPTSQSFLNVLFYRIYSTFLESNSILSPRQAGFHPIPSVLDQILYLSQSISDGFNKTKSGSRTIPATIRLFCKLRSAGFPPCFVFGLIFSFLIGRLHGFPKSQNSSLWSTSRCFAVIRYWYRFFSLFINDLSASLSSSVSCSFYVDDLVIWHPFRSVPAAVEAIHKPLILLDR